MPLPVALALVLAAAAAPAARAAAPPAVLPPVNRTLTADATAAAPCATTPAGRAGTAATTYTAPMSGYLNVRLDGRGDWDLLLRDGQSGKRLGASQGFGGGELVQTWIGAGQRVVAQGCRRDGAAKQAAVAFSLVDVRPPASPGAPKLVRVRGTAAQIEGLEARGLDVTHNRGRAWADVVVTGPAQLATLEQTGLPFTARIADLKTAYDAARAADARFAQRVGVAGSALPSGRTGYRTYEDYQADLKRLVDEHPGRVRKVVIGRSFQGREIAGVEIARDVDGADGRPVYFLMGVHHAREWPSGEAAMEFATMMAEQADDPRIAKLLDTERVVVVPIVNPDGFVSSRGALDPADSTGDPGAALSLAEAVAPPGGSFAYRRKNCDGELAGVGGADFPCQLAWGVDNNRNYGNLWGGPGSSADPGSQSYHGPGPRSEPETQAVWNYARTHHVTFLMTLHTVAALVLRPPGLHDAGLAPDEPRMKQLGDAMGDAAGYTSQYSWQLYDTAGTTEDDTYAATGGFGYTIEMGPPGGAFHEPYETGVVNEWTGQNDHAKNRGGLREALLIAAESAADPADHAVIEGTAPAGSVLRIRRSFDTTTSPFCPKGPELLLRNAPAPPCPGGVQDPLTLHDQLDTSTTVPADGHYAWHVGPSTRPFVGGGAVFEDLVDVDPPVATFSGQPAQPTGSVDHAFTLAPDQLADKLRITLDATLPEDYDIEVLRKQADGSLAPVGSSGNLPGAQETVVLDHPPAGDYVVRVAYYAAATGTYTVKVTRANATRRVTEGHKEAYTLTCENAAGSELERHEVVIDRGQALTLNLACGQPPAPPAAASTARSATPPARTPSVDGTPAPAGAAATAAAAARRADTARTTGPRRSAAPQRAARLAACRQKARRVTSARRRSAALRTCARRYGRR